MNILRLLNIQGVAGIAVSAALAIILVIQKVETSHWRKQSDQFAHLYHDEQASFAATVSNYRAAAAAARSADETAARHLADEQRAINERTEHEFEARLADVRARAERLHFAAAQADPSRGAATRMPGISDSSGGVDQATRENRLSPRDALTATEQAIQLDELIGWVKAQAALDPNAPPKDP